MDPRQTRADRLSLPSQATARLRGVQSKFTVEVNNLSLTGALVFSPDLRPGVGDMVDVSIAFPNQDHVVSLSGRVVRLTKADSDEAMPGFALAFGPAPDAATEHITGGDLFELYFSTTTPSETQFCLKDVDGRPLGELNTPEGSRRGSEFLVRECPFPGTRFGKLMNVTGLSEITHNWGSITSDLAVLRKSYLAQLGATELTVGDLWALSQTIAVVPNYLLRSKRITQKVPRRIAALFKSITGITMTAKRLLERNVAPDAIVGGDEFVKFTDENRVFNISDRTCAGPPHLVDEFMAILGGKQVEPFEPTLASVIGDPDRFVRYGISSIVQHVNGLLFKALTLRLMSELRNELAALPQPLRADPLYVRTKEATNAAMALAGALTLSPTSADAFKLIGARLADRLGLASDYGALSAPASTGVPYLPAVQAILAELHPQSSSSVRDVVAMATVRGLALEHASLRNFAAAQRAILGTLERANVAELEITSADLSSAFRPTVRDSVCRAVGIDAAVDQSGVSVSAAG
jgi:hypothetical protein